MNLYETLGVSKDASEQEIKTAFRKAAKQHHPDNDGDAAKFRAIQEAYDILIDPKKRAVYDSTGEPELANDRSKMIETRVLRIITDILDRGLSCKDIVKAASDRVRLEITEMHRKRVNGIKGVEATMKLRERITFHGEGRDFVTEFLDIQIDQGRTYLKVLDQDVEMANDAITLLEDYKDNGDTPVRSAAHYLQYGYSEDEE